MSLYLGWDSGMRGRYLTNVPQNEIFISRKEYKNLLRFALGYAIVYI